MTNHDKPNPAPPGSPTPLSAPAPEPETYLSPPSGPADQPTERLSVVESTGLPVAISYWAADDTTFETGDLIGGRFSVVSFIARGGMGEVYEAKDLELGESVALKTVRPEASSDPKTIERFRREIRLARQVTHPNVCRIFDVFRLAAVTPSGRKKPEVTFFTMELLRGETLTDKIRRDGSMAPAEALPFVRQMAGALEAAHRAGVIHRDFKCSNVVLVPSVDGLRAVVTDFGIARLAGSGDNLGSVVFQTGEMLGTPAYMAPEQVEGREITTAADVYALGIVIFQMVTANLPFDEPTPASMARKRLTTAPPSPRTLMPGLDVRWESVILRCLEREPAKRFASANDVVAALEGRPIAGRGSRAPRALLAALAVTIVLALVEAVILRRAGVSRKLESAASTAATAAPPSLPAPPKTLRRSIAVLGFKNLSGNTGFAWLSTALSEMFGSELAAGEKLRLVSGEEVARMKIDLALTEADSLAPDTLGRIRAHSHCDFVVLGSYFATGDKNGGRIRLDLKVQDTSGEGTLASFIGDGTEADLSALVAGTAARLREKLGAGDTLPADITAIRATVPQGPEALRLYSEGLATLRSFDALAAKDLLEGAVAADPNHGLAHSALASAWSALGYDQKAKAEAKKAFDLSANLPREDRLLVQGRYHEAMKEWDEATRTYRTLWTFAPDNLDYGLRLASAKTSGGKGKDALLVTKALRKLPPPARDDPRIDLEEAAAAQSLGNFEQALAAARRATEKGKKNDLRLVVARARLLESGAFQGLGEMEKAKSAAQEARAIYAAAGDKGGEAKALNNIANVLWSQGDLAGAKTNHEGSLAIKREIGDRIGVGTSLHNIATVLANQGDLAGAKKGSEEALAIFREIGNKNGVALSLNNIANVLSDQGDLSGAKRMYEESLALRREIGNKSGIARSLGNIAIVLEDQGDLAGAKAMCEESLALGREIGDKSGVAKSSINLASLYVEQADLAGAKKAVARALALAREIGQKSDSGNALEVLADVLEAEGDLPGARKHHEEALEIRQTLGEKLAAAASRLALAELSLEEGRSGEAMTAARQAAAFFQEERDPDSEAGARAALARALLEARDLAGAAKEIARCERLMQKSQKAMARESIAVTSARIRAASGRAADVAEARESLESSLAEATKNGWGARAFEIRLALGELEIRSDPAAGRVRLAGLEEDARAKGFGLIASKAARLAASTGR